MKPDDAVLESGDTVTTHVTFDPTFRGDFESAVVKNRLNVAYTDSTKKDGIDLIGEVHRPNLRFESSKVDFGSVLTDTNRRVVMKVTNCSTLDVVYHWVFYDDDAGMPYTYSIPLLQQQCQPGTFFGRKKFLPVKTPTSTALIVPFLS